MNSCVGCGAVLPKDASLYTLYAGTYICLSKCPACKRIADPYIEYDGYLLFIEMVLHRPEAYRHLLFNRFAQTFRDATEGTQRVHPRDAFMSVRRAEFWRLAFLLVLFEAYLAYDSNASAFDASPFATRYCGIVGKSALRLALIWSTIQGIARFYFRKDANQDKLFERLPFALLLASFPKLFHLLLVAWGIGDAHHRGIVRVAVVTSQAEALAALFGLSYWYAYGAVLSGHLLINSIVP